MIAVSSFRPLHKCTTAIAQNQLGALKSWLLAFERVVYVGDPCDDLSSILTEFVPGEDRPSIKKLCSIAATMGTWTALINSDVVATHKLKEVEHRMDAQGLMCAISQRHDLESGFVIDQGLDFFAARPEVWKTAYELIPSDFRISFGAWDNWMLGHFVCKYGKKCADITREKIIYHPKHEDRLSPNWESPSLQHKYIRQHFWPSTILR